jgi:hypothetical protein
MGQQEWGATKKAASGEAASERNVEWTLFIAAARRADGGGGATRLSA